MDHLTTQRVRACRKDLSLGYRGADEARCVILLSLRPPPAAALYEGKEFVFGNVERFAEKVASTEFFWNYAEPRSGDRARRNGTSLCEFEQTFG